MHYVTFKIIESRRRDFVLYLHNHSKKLIKENYRSKNIDKVVERLKKEMKHREHFMNALSNYIPVLNRIDKLEEKYPDGKYEKFPDGWTDPLELYGCYGNELDDSTYRESRELEKLLQTKSPEWIWKNRMRLVAESLYIRDFQGTCLLTNESGMESVYQKMSIEKFGHIVKAFFWLYLLS